MTSTRIRFYLLWMFKIATLVVSAPATVGVAIKINRGIDLPDGVPIFDRLETVLYFVVVVSSLLVIEFAFLYLWQLAEEKHQQAKDETETVVYVSGVWLAYAVIIVLGFLFSGVFDFSPFLYELIGSFCFRFTVGLILFFATYNTILKTRQKLADGVASGRQQSRKVIQRQKEANDSVAMLKISVIEDETKKAIEDKRDAIYQITSAQISRELMESKTNGHKTKAAEAKASGEVVTSNEGVVVNEGQGAAYDHPLFTVVPVDDGWLMQCKGCDEKRVKGSRISAIRTGSSHSKKHKVVAKKPKASNKKKEKNVEDVSLLVEGEVADQPNTDLQGF